MGIITITLNNNFWENACEYTIDWPIPSIIFLLIIISVYYSYRYYRKRKVNQNEEPVAVYNDPCDTIIPTKQIQIRPYNAYLFPILKFNISYITSVDIYRTPTIQINQPVNGNFSSIENRKLICYCDGSYSHNMQIGHFGFGASDGTCRIYSFSPDNPRCGSTDTEVLAAYHVIQYAIETDHNTLIIYTDNSKVEQLLKRPKEKDSINYENICQILKEYQQKNGNNSIEVIRVRGHTSISEQRKCKIKYEFAKIDRLVRKKTRQYIRRRWVSFQPNYYYYYYWYGSVYYSNYKWRINRYYF